MKSQLSHYIITINARVEESLIQASLIVPRYTLPASLVHFNTSGILSAEDSLPVPYIKKIESYEEKTDLIPNVRGGNPQYSFKVNGIEVRTPPP